jgi:hypothetical protein
VGEPWRFVVDAERTREFATAVRDTHQGPDLPAPPTFPTWALNTLGPVLTRELGLDLGRVLHGEEEYQYTRPLRSGDRLVCTSRIVADTVRRRTSGGALRVIVSETEMRDASSGELVVRTRSTILELRDGPA